MKKLFISFIFLFTFIYGFSQKEQIKTYNYSQLFQLIEEEQDSIFELTDAFIVFDQIKNKQFSYTTINSERIFNRRDTIVISKEIKLTNVIFDTDFSVRDSLNRQVMPIINHIIFTKKIELNNSFGARFSNCIFKERFRQLNDENLSSTVKKVQHKLSSNLLWSELNSCVFKNGINYSNFPLIDDTIGYGFDLVNSEISTKSSNEDSGLILIQTRNQTFLEVSKNKLKAKGWVFLFPTAKDEVIIEGNNFGESKIFMPNSIKDIPNFNFINNTINHPILLDLPAINDNANIGWEQLQGKIIHQGSFDKYFFNMPDYGLDSIPELNKGHFRSKEKIDYYVNKLRIEKQDAFNQEVKIRGKLYRLYKEQYQTEDANAVYMELKDLETQHLKFQFDDKPSFNKYFKWKVNQFLKVFSNYGTEPAKAVTFSFYVVLFFALIYLFFPNSWDSHGKNRIINRYRFFTKYMNKKAGIHEVYLEDKQQKLLEYEDFKNYMNASDKNMPRFFTATALPLYKWAISGTKLSASLLKRVDIMKGTWQELPKSKRIWKSILLVGAFTFAVLYDIFIKMLNALMLSINTFTTLGFGEIPIKGLPRYLAIIQGFIGWFMLTIFSVSLISQLLN